jgi:hypothetical protein
MRWSNLETTDAMTNLLHLVIALVSRSMPSRTSMRNLSTLFSLLAWNAGRMKLRAVIEPRDGAALNAAVALARFAFTLCERDGFFHFGLLAPRRGPVPNSSQRHHTAT